MKLSRLLSLSLVSIALMGCRHEEPRNPTYVIVQEMPKAPDVKMAEDVGATITGGAYRAGKATYEYATSDEVADKARRFKEWTKEKAKSAADAASKALDD